MDHEQPSLREHVAGGPMGAGPHHASNLRCTQPDAALVMTPPWLSVDPPPCMPVSNEHSCTILYTFGREAASSFLANTDTRSSSEIRAQSPRAPSSRCCVSFLSLSFSFFLLHRSSALQQLNSVRCSSFCVSVRCWACSQTEGWHNCTRSRRIWGRYQNTVCSTPCVPWFNRITIAV